MATLTAEERKTSTLIKPPSMYKVVFNNDDKTPMDFVVEILIHLFHHERVVASAIMEEVHLKGKGVAGVYSYEIADQKAIEATSLARANGYPLSVTIEVNE
jgi:ATP-dependent Clp protease adaptor protein ClpS